MIREKNHLFWFKDDDERNIYSVWFLNVSSLISFNSLYNILWLEKWTVCFDSNFKDDKIRWLHLLSDSYVSSLISFKNGKPVLYCRISFNSCMIEENDPRPAAIHNYLYQTISMSHFLLGLIKANTLSSIIIESIDGARIFFPRSQFFLTKLS